MVMDGGAGDEAGALAADGEEWDWKSRLAPLEEEEAAAAAKRSLEDREEDDGAWRDEDDYGNPTAEKKVKLSKEKSELYAHHSERQRRADEKAAVKKVADVALLEKPPLESESVALTLLDGSRYFAEVAATAAGREAAVNPFANGGLLATSVGALRAELLAAGETSTAPMDVDGAAAPDEEAEDENDARRRFDGRLWVDKYAPSAFHHLLSDERANREVLRALKDWDPFVFKRPAPPPPRQPAYQSFGGGSGGRGGGGGKGFDRGPDRSSSGGRRLDAPRRLNAKRGEYKDRPRSANCVTVAMGRGGGQGGRGRGGQGGFRGGKGKGSGGGKGAAAFGGGEAPKTIGDDKRPLVRVILLTGEPGTGKTTLAHVLANAAGYRVREINASDERSAEAGSDGEKTTEGKRAKVRNNDTYPIADDQSQGWCMYCQCP